jgi:hypothetical protein
MGTLSLTGKDTITLDNRILADFGKGDVATLEFQNDLATVSVGKNGNAIIAYNASGQAATLTIKVLSGSADDKWLNSRMYEFINDPPSFVLLNGEFVKRIGDKAGNKINQTYTMSAGAFTKMPGAKENTEGDDEQAQTTYAITFANTGRSM